MDIFSELLALPFTLFNDLFGFAESIIDPFLNLANPLAAPGEQVPPGPDAATSPWSAYLYLKAKG